MFNSFHLFNSFCSLLFPCPAPQFPGNTRKLSNIKLSGEHSENNSELATLSFKNNSAIPKIILMLRNLRKLSKAQISLQIPSHKISTISDMQNSH